MTGTGSFPSPSSLRVRGQDLRLISTQLGAASSRAIGPTPARLRPKVPTFVGYMHPFVLACGHRLRSLSELGETSSNLSSNRSVYEPLSKMGHATIVLLFLAAVTCPQPVSCSDNTTDVLEVTIAEQAKKLTELEEVLLQQASRLTKAEAITEQLAATVGSLEAKQQTGSNQGVPVSPLVAFDVQYSDDPHHNVQDDDVMAFDNVITNIGNGYNAQNGTFQAPVSGVYVFHVKVTPSPSGHIYVYLVANGKHVDSANANDANNTETGVSLKIIQLQQGESVWVVKNDGMTSVRGWAHSKLSGFLLWHTH